MCLPRERCSSHRLADENTKLLMVTNRVNELLKWRLKDQVTVAYLK